MEKKVGFCSRLGKNKWGRVINITGSVEPREVNIANAAKSAIKDI